MKYRAEIDGLRAVAVIPVILFHAGFSIFSGGYIGVDIFFVISGYLITSILVDELNRDDFSILRFYERRARRILPALSAVMLCCIPFAFMWMMPSHYEEFSRSLIAVVLFVSNIFFWRESGYFSEAADEKPLINTWSLAVEEQYYLFFPLLLWAVWRIGRGRLSAIIIALAALISLALCEYASRHVPNANFFLIPTRAWELFTGSLCALYLYKREQSTSQSLSLLGMAMVLFAIFNFDDSTRHPSLITIVPVLGVVFIILFATQGTIASKILSMKPMVGVGLISYSVYLWHQPLFAFARTYYVLGVSDLTYLMLCVVCLILAYLSWRFIEQPFRLRGSRAVVNNRQLTWFSLIAVCVFIGVAVYGISSNGREEYWSSSVTSSQLKAYELTEEVRYPKHAKDNGDCHFLEHKLLDSYHQRIEECEKRYGKGILIIGDSHSMDLFYIFNIAADVEQFPFLVAIADMCPPYPSVPNCRYDLIHDYLQNNDSFDTIIYSQAAFGLTMDANAKAVTRERLIYTPLIDSFSQYHPNEYYIDKTAEFLEGLNLHSASLIWLGSRIGPQIKRSSIVELGCDHEFALRHGQRELFVNIEEAIKKRIAGTHIKYVSQIDINPVNMPDDFISCERLYWSDGDHYSDMGEIYFSERLNLNRVLNRKTP